MLELLYAPFRLFQAVPLTALLPAILLAAAATLVGGASRASRVRAAGRTIAYLAAGCWGLYTCWELFLFNSRPIPNIRIDLLLISPVLLGITAAASFLLILAVRQEKR